ncbi:CLUMA_CG004265, isoform A [Clunio marinus]|uniref:CLUMA_CG004265, isoform A n=1 Tax=Clunio marinus TaxID=568069 RepID=A0A1J1HSP0_9DIPT|nr:CLUMA_CG004265, isoform A [Clunio marinus]
MLHSLTIPKMESKGYFQKDFEIRIEKSGNKRICNHQIQTLIAVQNIRRLLLLSSPDERKIRNKRSIRHMGPSI